MSKTSEYPSMKSRTLALSHNIPISKTKTYWEGLGKGEVYATKCKKCGEFYYPPQIDCPNCFTSDVEWVRLFEGTLETFTQAYLKPQGFAHYEYHYIVAIAKTMEGVKVMGWLEDVEVNAARVGMAVQITAGIMPDGFPAIIFKPK